MDKKNLTGWGLFPKIKSLCISTPTTLPHLQNLKNPFIPFGNGRSYGDSALAETTLHTRNHQQILSFNLETGVLHAQGGILLSEILKVIMPKGWFLNVTPGTSLITLGGAIASDIHGKNHHLHGCFSEDVIEFTLLNHLGTFTIQKQDPWFYATCGGMGLTGIILDAKIQLKNIRSNLIQQTTIKTKNLKETFETFQTYQHLPYSVAWIDCLAKKNQQGRCIFMGGDFCSNGPLHYSQAFQLKIPFYFPNWILNTYTVSAFNTAYYFKTKKEISQHIVPFHQFFYPLDNISDWNKLYGKNGLTQYQFIIPKQFSLDGLSEILTLISNSGKGSFLAVLKLYGPENKNYLSFPIEGYSLALDFKIEPDLFPLLNELDKIVLKYKGRLYLSKDVRVSADVFEKGYPLIQAFRTFRKQYGLTEFFQSYQSRRLNL